MLVRRVLLVLPAQCLVLLGLRVLRVRRGLLDRGT